ncbi:CMRF35-like molecule 8 isoform X1 [Platichthys flesus]|uniref:CMRF35-like molecule 8 isoform X1 n=1 Tax=Platichthys flesus TaxID=8260 RepID=UPI002DBAFF27|nr:CMRF35-like molecule 8 isoform X1 [Platichthys flesus]
MKPALRSEKEKGRRRMSSMEQVFLILIFAGGFWKTEAITVKGELGGDITITCSHSNAHDNIKYFCKAPCRDEDILIKSSEKSKGRYSITDKGNTFYVTISRLTEDDTGTYQCGIERVFAWDTYQEVVLKVLKGKTKEPDDDFSQSTRGEAITTTATRPTSTTTATRPASTTTCPASTTNVARSNKSESGGKLVYIRAGLGGAVLALAVVLLIFYKHQKKEISTTSEKKQDPEDDFSQSRFRKRRDDVSADEGEIDSENDDIAKEVRSMIRLSEKNSGAHRPKQDRSTSVYTEVEYSHLISVKPSAAPEVLQNQDIQLQMSSAPLQRSAAYVYHP